MRYFVTIGDREVEVDLGIDGISVDGEPMTADLVEMDGSDVHSLLIGEKSYRVLASREENNAWNLHVYGHKVHARVMDERTRRIQSMAATPDGPRGPKPLKAPMPGLVVKVVVEAGDTVSPGQGLVIVEAMKMENELKSEGEGRIARILVEPGEAVNKDQVLVEFESPREASDKGSEE
ncbi:MAG: acetyl-CoA carboxylase biotin carboxyl carrier protein subunit [Gemmatimonadetes bacterium]|nr:acetyl-CoA carboxylase biotin carboxyl carrier protein subunit [Gemmatimonadota bacterium]